MEQLPACPECGSTELRRTNRTLDAYTEVDVTICGVCHWASDPRVGRPPADRGKNFTLRRLMKDVKGPAGGPVGSTRPGDDGTQEPGSPG